MPRVLVFTRTAGYRHASIPAGAEAVRELGADHGFMVDVTDDTVMFSPDILARYRALVFLSTTGELFTDAHRRALESYVRGGGGFAGVHAAADAEYDWPFYGELVGARFARHPDVQSATVLVQDRDHPATAHLRRTWTRTDEWYDFASAPSARVRVLLTVDESSYEGAGMGEPHPLAWCHDVGEGRCFYTALGHTAESFTEPQFRAHLLGGIRYAARLAGS
ncbi:ThuA domain-containing protein [Actinomadura keratinilytica]|jgi:type 1 glutamine amidotransferase|uniref:ThuA domain-containing protein n=1 Tax=Actinomadura keratinilytica TaxID=547461 RepID=A0ABP7YEL5_9ACTN